MDAIQASIEQEHESMDAQLRAIICVRYPRRFRPQSRAEDMAEKSVALVEYLSDVVEEEDEDFRIPGVLAGQSHLLQELTVAIFIEMDYEEAYERFVKKYPAEELHAVLSHSARAGERPAAQLNRSGRVAV